MRTVERAFLAVVAVMLVIWAVDRLADAHRYDVEPTLHAIIDHRTGTLYGAQGDYLGGSLELGRPYWWAAPLTLEEQKRRAAEQKDKESK